MTRWIHASLLVALIAAPSFARADEASDAKDLFERGRVLRAHDDCAHAVDLFRKAYQVYPTGLGSLRNVAECEESLEHWASARRAWAELKRALVVEHSAKYESWDRDATDADARLAPKVARVTVHILALTTPHSGPAVTSDVNPVANVIVTFDGEPLEAALLDTELERDPGRHVVRARIGEGEWSEGEVSVSQGHQATVTLNVHAPPMTPSVSTDRGAEVVAPAQTTLIVGWSSVGIGAAALVGASVAFGVRQSALSSLRSECPNYASAPCSSSLSSTVSRGQLASTLTTAFAIGAGVALAAGITLVLLAPHRAVPAVTASIQHVEATWTF